MNGFVEFSYPSSHFGNQVGELSRRPSDLLSISGHEGLVYGYTQVAPYGNLLKRWHIPIKQDTQVRHRSLIGEPSTGILYVGFCWRVLGFIIVHNKRVSMSAKFREVRERCHVAREGPLKTVL